ncbi:hypothetical protein BJX76DRAFT_355872 [Aspergillus varians]
MSERRSPSPHESSDSEPDTQAYSRSGAPSSSNEHGSRTLAAYNANLRASRNYRHSATRGEPAMLTGGMIYERPPAFEHPDPNVQAENMMGGQREVILGPIEERSRPNPMHWVNFMDVASSVPTRRPRRARNPSSQPQEGEDEDEEEEEEESSTSSDPSYASPALPRPSTTSAPRRSTRSTTRINPASAPANPESSQQQQQGGGSRAASRSSSSSSSSQGQSSGSGSHSGPKVRQSTRIQALTNQQAAATSTSRGPASDRRSTPYGDVGISQGASGAGRGRGEPTGRGGPVRTSGPGSSSSRSSSRASSRGKGKGRRKQ